MIFSNSQDTIEFNDTNIPLHIKKIGIKMSGGADSSIVCYMLAKYVKECRPDIILYPITSVATTKPYQKIFAENVIKKVSNLLDFKNFGEHFISTARSTGSSEYIEDQSKFLQELYASNKIQMHFNGISAIPYEKDAPELYKKLEALPVGEDRYKRENKKSQFFENRFSPLINIDKKGISELYKNLGVLDELFPITRSCEKRTEDFTSHCGECWFCKERFWAFNRYE